MKGACIFLTAVFFMVFGVPFSGGAQGDYVGTETCGDCHEYEYDNFMEYSKKPYSWEHITKMRPKLKDSEFKECLECHTTGYERGGFVSYEETPELADVGCETCHGPGEEHVETGGDPAAIKGRISQEDCQRCHNEARVEDFNFKPLIYGGVH
ncbi:MAG: multiheme c-type cytochrome [Desulfonatronovibrionaceae bacterium]